MPISDDYEQVLREYLYVDVTMVRGVLAQLESGVDETETVGGASNTSGRLGVKGFLEGAKQWNDHQGTSRSLAEFHFPYLEYALEESGYLQDYSNMLNGTEPRDDRSNRHCRQGRSFVSQQLVI